MAELMVTLLGPCDIPATARGQLLMHKFNGLDDVKTLAGTGVTDLSVLHVRRRPATRTTNLLLFNLVVEPLTNCGRA